MNDKLALENQDFLQNVLGLKQILTMFDLLPDIIFWIKNANSEIIYANNKFVEHIGLHSLQQVYGKSDVAFFPPHIAKQFINDDKSVMNGQVITDRIELNMLKTGDFAWFSTSKRPLYDHNQHIVGSYGFTQLMNKTSQVLSSIDAIKAPVEFVRENYHKDICVEQLAQTAFLSVSALERRFKKYLSKTPKQFINEIRLENARRLLIETRLPIVEVAYRCGFSEHSYFSRQFKALFGTLPSQLRDTLHKDS
ncbi:MAG: AraC family transcriptional regulator [Paraglaciecola sp.]|uniref:AraC family transcriptional regulator n=1 Tax=Paraglaciecola sp. TaxID=1920173 RepID=UPI00273DA03F|nr:AraC family transcriptional regulator [Paraglaciecola sp.]MDP5031371.1 AraC family transcriptional regulator [Paraglaciecola sp.]MDP5039479.1 AraC family transcriptional regulator [Paraglaciecola sp.]MDP5133135.1 AraC family transcriptional regulator [Paraglaciecola sp.]